MTPVHSHLKTKATTEADRYHLSKQQQNHLCPSRALLRNTPLCPLSRGETPPLKPFITNKKTVSQSPLSRGEIPPLTPFITYKKTAPQNSPLERGRGCVTPEHSHLKTKTVTEADRYRLSKQQQKHLYPSRAPHRHPPFIPSGEWKPTL